MDRNRWQVPRGPDAHIAEISACCGPVRQVRSRWVKHEIQPSYPPEAALMRRFQESKAWLDLEHSAACVQNYLLMSCLSSRRFTRPSTVDFAGSGAAARASFISFTAPSKSPLATASLAAS